MLWLPGVGGGVGGQGRGDAGGVVAGEGEGVGRADVEVGVFEDIELRGVGSVAVQGVEEDPGVGDCAVG